MKRLGTVAIDLHRLLDSQLLDKERVVALHDWKRRFVRYGLALIYKLLGSV